MAGGTSYVRIGELFRAVPLGGSTEYFRQYLVFGMSTLPSMVPRNGTAGYHIEVRGTAADLDFPNLLDLQGTGSLFIDLATARIRGFVPLTFTEQYSAGGRAAAVKPGEMTIDGELGASEAIAGNVHLSGPIGEYLGSFQGRRYGPTAEEVGATFSAGGGVRRLGNATEGFIVGAFAGVKDGAATDPEPAIPTLNQGGVKTFGLSQIAVPFAPDGLVGITYNPAGQSYQVTFADLSVNGSSSNTQFTTGGTVTFSSATLDTSQPNLGFDAHTTLIGGGQRVRAVILRPDNQQVALSYLSFGRFFAEIQNTATTTTDPAAGFQQFAIFGNRSISVPLSGSASYSGLVFGYADVTTNLGTDLHTSGRYDVNGRSFMTVDFGARTFSATLDQLVGTRTSASTISTPLAVRNFDPIVHTGILHSGSNFESSMRGPMGLDQFTGSFYGPNGAEFGTVFFQKVGTFGVDPLAWEVTGVAAGKKN